MRAAPARFFFFFFFFAAMKITFYRRAVTLPAYQHYWKQLQTTLSRIAYAVSSGCGRWTPRGLNADITTLRIAAPHLFLHLSRRGVVRARRCFARAIRRRCPWCG